MNIEVKELVGEKILIVRNFLSLSTCQKLIARSESDGLEVTNYNQKYRSNKRLVKEDKILANYCFHMLNSLIENHNLRSCLPLKLVDDMDLWKLTHINPLFRFCRYDPGDMFLAHYDSSKLAGEEEGYYTFMIYLNTLTDQQGGTTRFYGDVTQEEMFKLNNDANHDVTPAFSLRPEEGMLIVFPQRKILHDGEQLKSGVKYICRSDIVYKPI